LGEFDALPGLSKTKYLTKNPLHIDRSDMVWHKSFGWRLIGAAASIKRLIRKGRTEGTIRFFMDTPAEENSRKLWMIPRPDFFNDVDVMMDWHPADVLRQS